jgi:hypothetical protein
MAFYHVKSDGVRVTGTHNGGNNSAVLIDTTKNFTTSVLESELVCEIQLMPASAQ